jgi:hypothetical protein
MNRRDWAVRDHPGQRSAVLVRQSRLLARRLAVSQTFRPLGVEPHHPIANDLPRHAADPGRLDPLGAIINRRKIKKPTRLSPILRLSRNGAQARSIKISPKQRSAWRTSFVRNVKIRSNPIRESRPESLSPGAGISWSAAFTFLAAFAAASQDVTIDGWRIDVVPIERQTRTKMRKRELCSRVLPSYGSSSNDECPRLLPVGRGR